MSWTTTVVNREKNPPAFGSAIKFWRCKVLDWRWMQAIGIAGPGPWPVTNRAGHGQDQPDPGTQGLRLAEAQDDRESNTLAQALMAVEKRQGGVGGHGPRGDPGSSAMERGRV